MLPLDSWRAVDATSNARRACVQVEQAARGRWTAPAMSTCARWLLAAQVSMLELEGVVAEGRCKRWRGRLRPAGRPMQSAASR